MAWLLATIGKSDSRNWEICKEHNLWGISVLGESDFIHKASKGDNLLFWVSGKGFVGTAVATEDTKVPKGPEETPWRGGNARYGFIIPVKFDREFNKPIKLNFSNNVQEKTGIPLAYFRRGFQPIGDVQAKIVLDEASLFT